MASPDGPLARAMEENRRALDSATTPELRELLPVLREARDELRAKLAHLEDDTFSASRARSVFVQLDRVIDDMGKRAHGALARDLKTGEKRAGRAAIRALERTVEAGAAEFPASVSALQLDVAAVLANAERTMLARFSRESMTYSMRLENQMRRSIMSGIIRGETVDEMTSRVMRGTGLVRKLQGRTTAEQLDAIVARPFTSARSSAERIVRTELVNAYGEVSEASIQEANLADPGYLKVWDAAADRRVCPICFDLDGEMVDPGASFSNGADHPPAHPRCRCSCEAWRREWGKYPN